MLAQYSVCFTYYKINSGCNVDRSFHQWLLLFYLLDKKKITKGKERVEEKMMGDLFIEEKVHVYSLEQKKKKKRVALSYLEVDS